MVRKEVHKGFWWETLSETGHLGDPGVHGKMDLQKVGRGVMDWIDLP